MSGLNFPQDQLKHTMKSRKENQFTFWLRRPCSADCPTWRKTNTSAHTLISIQRKCLMRLMMHFDRMTEMSNISDAILKSVFAFKWIPKGIPSLLTCWLNLFINIQPTQRSNLRPSVYIESAGRDGNTAAFTARKYSISTDCDTLHTTEVYQRTEEQIHLWIHFHIYGRKLG